MITKFARKISEDVMVKLKDKVVFISGATSGIGKACAFAFANEGAKLIICARRKNKLDVVADDIKKRYGVKVCAIELDVRNRADVENAIANLSDEWKKINVLVNNAGMGRGLGKIYDDNPDGWEEMIDTNVKGLLYVTRFILPGMVERQSGHIINIGSIAGRETYPGGAVYCASKHAVTSITRGLRLDTLGKNVRISTVDPGLVKTNFSVVRFYGDEKKAKNAYKGYTPLAPEDVADAVIYVATRPPHVNIAEMIVFPTAQASSMHVHKES